ncbi:uncharacterized protein EV420DRAFT_761105 [Desarmillaria tabescens]|uniref:Uncharacterized protein n=1 Tax=Armillaria tabescens TaxID=1929756 RepID=A0AA39JVS0_ARMTA|nr:uncharacterized protein EV420DRAFT_761105 [Desarmillaria tabescens]KAK0449714.1 hypothetical protein EV420DRAFT_761105 [Desarmillaria tabescens]
MSSTTIYVQGAPVTMGVNRQGNFWCSFVDGSGNTSYHYQNQNGSTYSRQSDGSSFYNDGQGFSLHTPAPAAVNSVALTAQPGPQLS